MLKNLWKSIRHLEAVFATYRRIDFGVANSLSNSAYPSDSPTFASGEYKWRIPANSIYSPLRHTPLGVAVANAAE